VRLGQRPGAGATDQETSLSPNTINVRLAAIKSLVKASATMGAFPALLSHEFCLVGKVKLSTLRHRLRRAKHRRYTPAEVRRLCQAPDPLTLVGLRDRALLNTMASSECRLAEVLSLTREHIVARETGYGMQVLSAPLLRHGLCKASRTGRAASWHQRHVGVLPPAPQGLQGEVF
jgi:integrase